jgi:hypothetical protein
MKKGLTVLQKIYCLQRQLKEYRNCSKSSRHSNNYEIAQKQIEVDLLNQQKQIKDNTNLVFDISFLALLIVGLFRRYQFINKTKKIIERKTF